MFAGQPAIGDVDGDRVPDLITAVSSNETRDETTRRLGKSPSPRDASFARWFVQAISGRSGRLLWSFPLDRAFTYIKPSYGNCPGATLVRGRTSSRVALFDGDAWIFLDAATGKPQSGPVDLGDVPVRPVQYADLDGDGEPELLMLSAGPAPKQQSLTAFAIASGQPRWTATIRGTYARVWNGDLTVDWPWLVDLDGDGRTEIVVPDSGPMPPKAGYRGLQVLDGATGRSRWGRPLRPETRADDGLRHVIEVPDLDGDGLRELIVVSRFEGRDPPATPLEPRFDLLRCMSMRFRARMVIRSGSGTRRFRRRKPATSGARRGGAAARMVGRSWLSLWAEDMESADRGMHSSGYHPPVVHVLEASTGRP